MNMRRPMQNGKPFFPAQNMCEVSYHDSKLTKFANFSFLPAQVQGSAGQDNRVPVILLEN